MHPVRTGMQDLIFGTFLKAFAVLKKNIRLVVKNTSHIF